MHQKMEQYLDELYFKVVKDTNAVSSSSRVCFATILSYNSRATLPLPVIIAVYGLPHIREPQAPHRANIQKKEQKMLKRTPETADTTRFNNASSQFMQHSTVWCILTLCCRLLSARYALPLSGVEERQGRVASEKQKIRIHYFSLHFFPQFFLKKIHANEVGCLLTER